MSRKIERRRCLFCNTLVKRAADFYCDNKCQRGLQWKTTLDKITTNQSVENIGQARRYFKEKFPHSCMLCNSSLWTGQPIPLLIDHIDGNSENWFLTNLRKICPNCDALLPTFKSRNKGKGRAYRRARYAAGKSY
jgi:hypothetical protein